MMAGRNKARWRSCACDMVECAAGSFDGWSSYRNIIVVKGVCNRSFVGRKWLLIELVLAKVKWKCPSLRCRLRRCSSVCRCVAKITTRAVGVNTNGRLENHEQSIEVSLNEELMNVMLQML